MDIATPRIVGILNVTPDSFSDGGRYQDPDVAARRAEELWSDGAEWVDLGPASSHPRAATVMASEEIRRLGPVLDRLRGHEARLSVDSFQPETQRYALSRGVSVLNDVRGFEWPELYPELARAGCTLIVMHALPRDPPMPPRDAGGADALWLHMERFFAARVEALERAGVSRSRLILDPGMGFFLGSDPMLSLDVLCGIARLRDKLGLPVLIGVSRKSFLGTLTGRDVAERGAATLAAELFAADRGVDYIRTHDVRALRDALCVRAALSSVPG